MEWFVQSIGPSAPFTRKARARPSPATRTPFEISAASSSHTCTAASLTGQQPFGQTSCSDAHAFYIACESCDQHDDSAWGCQIESVARDKCVEARADSGELSWKNCVVGRGVNVSRRRRACLSCFQDRQVLTASVFSTRAASQPAIRHLAALLSLATRLPPPPRRSTLASSSRTSPSHLHTNLVYTKCPFLVWDFNYLLPFLRRSDSLLLSFCYIV